MSIADDLRQAFADARAGVAVNRDAAAAAAVVYIGRRLLQLERRFPRHRFVYMHYRYRSGLRVYPAMRIGVGRWPCFDMQSITHNHLGRMDRFPVFRRLFGVQLDLDEVAREVERSFDRMLGRIGSSQREPRRSVEASCGVNGQDVYEAHMLLDAEEAGDPGAAREVAENYQAHGLKLDRRRA